MKSQSSVRRDQLALQILEYLRTHSDAQDTAEGIAEWWSLEHRVRNEITEVKRSLLELVAQGLVVEKTGRDGRAHFRLNPRKRRVATHVRRRTERRSVSRSTIRGGNE